MRPLVALLLAGAVLACGSGSAPAADEGQASALCAALTSLVPNDADFVLILKGDDPSEAYAAIDRVVSRTEAAIASMRAITGPVGDEARALADLEQGLIPVMAMLRDVTDEASFATATRAYTRWYTTVEAASPPIEARLAALGVRSCK